MAKAQLMSITNAKQLVVDGQPFLVRGAELQNSSFSSAQHMASLWQKLLDMNVNTVLSSVSWEMIEPQEDHFDFSEIDQIIKDARKHDLKLILLWFGAWKNGISTYAPAWVKMDPNRFRRVEVRNVQGGTTTTETLSAVAPGSTVEVDARAFRTFMKHLKEFDEVEATVIMVQVENEVGLLGDSRDRSELATRAFEAPVPLALIDYLQQEWTCLHPDLVGNLDRAGCDRANLQPNKSWEATFGSSIYTNELFMAYHYAIYLNAVAEAGKMEYDLPLFANFWLNYGADDMAEHYPVVAGGGNKPGDYPSGGAVSNVLDIWIRFAPALDLLCPDTYLNDYHRVCQTYRHRNLPLFIPEQRRDEYGARRIWGAIGSYQAIGACPFALDTLEADTCAYTKHYRLLAQVSHTVLVAQRKPDQVIGFFYDEHGTIGPQPPETTVTVMGGYELRIERAFTTGLPGPGWGLVILLSVDQDGTAKFLLVGEGFQVKFKSVGAEVFFTGILSFVEKQWNEDDQDFRTARRLNGDETRSGHQAIMPNEEPDTGGFPININIPAVTRVAECTVYRLKR
ncbi:hypothetical protein ACHAPJ_008508 [Fusarium lateritium]